MLKYSSSAHFERANHNQQFSLDIENLDGDYRDWQVTANFYSAVHTLQAYFKERTSAYPTSHAERDRLVASDPNLRTIYQDYRELKSLSVSTRYSCRPTNDYDVQESLALLKNIREYIDTFFIRSDE